MNEVSFHALFYGDAVGIVAASSYQLLRQAVLPEFMQSLHVKYTFNKVENKLILPNNTTVHFVSTENISRLYGFICNWVCFQTFSTEKSLYDWNILQSRVRLPEMSAGMNRTWLISRSHYASDQS
jgi:hypothetical protein